MPTSVAAAPSALVAQQAAPAATPAAAPAFTLAPLPYPAETLEPVIDARTRQPVFHEALLRLTDHAGEPLLTGQVVTVAEKLGLVRLIDQAVVLLAADALERHPDVRISINISGTTATDPRWYPEILSVIGASPGVAGRMIIEITETVALGDLSHTIRFVEALRQLGCSVAIDDFGAGYTSFRNLKALAIDSVKIDGSFVRGLADNVDNQLFIKTLLGLADGFGLETVAECVENAVEAQHLSRRGVKLLQGNLFGLPSIERPWLAPLGLDGLSAAPARPTFAVVPGKG